MCRVGCDKPVTADQCRIWIVIPKQSVRNARCPHITFQMLPVIHNFRTGNHSFSRFHRTVHNSCILTSRIRRIYIFPIYARRYKHLVAGPCNFCRLGNRLKWIFLLPISASHSISIYINLHFSLTSHFFTLHKLLLFFVNFRQNHITLFPISAVLHNFHILTIIQILVKHYLYIADHCPDVSIFSIFFLSSVV